MPFSFNPGQQAPQPQGAPGQALQPSAQAVAATMPSVPDSPFLFMQHRDQEMTVNAYLQIILMMVAALSVVIAVVFFLYSSYLKASIASNKAKLESQDTTFKDYPIAEMQRFYSRGTSLNTILQGYISVRSPLKFLEDVVEKQVVFNDFALTKKDTGYTASFSAITTNYRSLLQQLDALNLTEYKKVVPGPKLGKVSDSVTTVKVNVTTPIFAQGVLPDSVVFLPATTTPAQVGNVQSNNTGATSTPQ